MDITIIGCGNLGSAILTGFLRKEVCGHGNITVADADTGKLKRLRAEYPGIRTTEDNITAVKRPDVIIVAVKPWMMLEVLTEVSPHLDRGRQVIVSVAAGVDLDQLSHYVSEAEFGLVPIYRIIPNIAARYGDSVTFICTRDQDQSRQSIVGELFSALGTVHYVPENEIPAVTALTSSGLAFAVSYLSASAKGGEQLGLNGKTSLEYAIETMKGAISVLANSERGPEEEIRAVTTPGGITEKGLKKMEELGFSTSIIEGLKATR